MVNLRQKLTSIVTRRYPFLSGCALLANSNIVKFMSGTQGGSTWCRVPGGEVYVDLSDYIGRAAFFTGDLDRKISMICKKIVRKGDTVFDIGANIGIVTVLLSDLVGPNGNVYSFEPNPRMVSHLREAIDRNRISNVKLYPVALGPKQSILDLVIPNDNKGAASLVRHKERKDCEVISVEVNSLDAIIKNERLCSVRLIKIDVEGFESAVFEGAHELLSSNYLPPTESAILTSCLS